MVQLRCTDCAAVTTTCRVSPRMHFKHDVARSRHLSRTKAVSRHSRQQNANLFSHFRRGRGLFRGTRRWLRGSRRSGARRGSPSSRRRPAPGTASAGSERSASSVRQLRKCKTENGKMGERTERQPATTERATLDCGLDINVRFEAE